jgi:nucleoside-diphosphate-sugar epimerase
MTGVSDTGADLCVVTGAFGYSGKYIATRLLAAGKRVRTLTNSPQRHNPFGATVEAHPYNFDRFDDLARSLQGARVLINTYCSRCLPDGAPSNGDEADRPERHGALQLIAGVEGPNPRG